MAEDTPNFEMAKVVISFEADPESVRKFADAVGVAVMEKIGDVSPEQKSTPDRGSEAPVASPEVREAFRGAERDERSMQTGEMQEELSSMREQLSRMSQALDQAVEYLNRISQGVYLGNSNV